MNSHSFSLPVPSRDEFAEGWTESAGRVSYFLEGYLDNAEVGTSLRFCVYFQDEDIELSCDALVSWRRLQGGRRLSVRPGVSLALTPGYDLELLKSYVEGKELISRGARRFSFKAKALVSTGMASATWGTVSDLSESGAALISTAPAREDQLIALRIFPKGSVLGQKFRATVRWKRGHEIGVEFSEADRVKAAKIVFDAEQQSEELVRLTHRPL